VLHFPAAGEFPEAQQLSGDAERAILWSRERVSQHPDKAHCNGMRPLPHKYGHGIVSIITGWKPVLRGMGILAHDDISAGI
jgi:hypothetical protein